MCSTRAVTRTAARLKRRTASPAQRGTSAEAPKAATRLRSACLLLGDLDLAVVDGGKDVARVLAVDGAAHRVGRAEDLLHRSGELLGERLEAHRARDVDDLLHRDVARVLDVLGALFPVPLRLQSMSEGARAASLGRLLARDHYAPRASPHGVWP